MKGTMNSAPLIIAFLPLASFGFLNTPFPLPSEQIRLLANRKAGEEKLLKICPEINFNYCQSRFAESLGLDPSIHWQQADVLLQRLQELTSANMTSLLTTCANRAQYYQCLGVSYYDCVSLYNLFSKSKTDSDLDKAYVYVATLREGDFLCNTGFEEVADHYDCLMEVPKSKEYAACSAEYTENIKTNPFCEVVEGMSRCLNGAYAAVCTEDPRGTGWFGCEDYRQATIDVCIPGPRCFVH